MPRFVAFLRAINVGGRTVTMDALRSIFESCGLKDVETFLASGNVMFTATKKEPALRTVVETALTTSLGYEVTTFLRTDAEVAAITRSPLLARRRRNVPTVVVGFLHDALDAAATKRLMALETTVDHFAIEGREIYWLCDVKQSESKITLAAVERAIAVCATFRAVSTVERLAAKLAKTNELA